MIKKISEKQFKIAYRSAGLGFVGCYMEAFLLRMDELQDKLLKKKLIEEIYDNGENTFDKKIGGTITRVNCLLRIIEAGRVVEALEIVASSKYLLKINPYPVSEAKSLLKRINDGEYCIQYIS